MSKRERAKHKTKLTRACLIPLQVMDKTVGAMHLSSDAKKLIRLDLAQVPCASVCSICVSGLVRMRRGRVRGCARVASGER